MAPPYGIVFVADMLAALMVLTTLIVAPVCSIPFGHRGESITSMPFSILLAGVIGSFLTGDLFNLFVCFEVMLIASYALIVLGRKRRLRETLKYMLINIISSTLFVATVAYLRHGRHAEYGASVPARGRSTAGWNIIGHRPVVPDCICLEGGLVPVLLAGSQCTTGGGYSFVRRAKVGLYAIIRTFTLIFHHDTGGIHAVIGWMAAATMILGSLGAVAYGSWTNPEL